MYQSTENGDEFSSEWKLFEGQQPLSEWHYAQPDALPPGKPEWPFTYSTQETPPRSSNDQSTQNKDSPLSREMTPGSTSSTATNSKEAAYSRRLSQNRKAQRAHRARQKQHVESLEQQLKTVLSKYNDLQQRYSSLSASYERLAKEKERKKIGKNHEQQSRSDPYWRSGVDHVTARSWNQDAIEVENCIPNNWQQ